MTMNKHTRLMTSLALLATLSTGAAFATGALPLPDEVKGASLQVPRGTPKGELIKLAKIDQAQAEAAALAALPGKVLKAKLEKEDGYLVWQVDIQHAQGVSEVAVDAGNGKVLALEAEEDDDHEG
jgi:uncharacterized membrane protein YkoI